MILKMIFLPQLQKQCISLQTMHNLIHTIVVPNSPSFSHSQLFQQHLEDDSFLLHHIYKCQCVKTRFHYEYFQLKFRNCRNIFLQLTVFQLQNLLLNFYLQFHLMLQRKQVYEEKNVIHYLSCFPNLGYHLQDQLLLLSKKMLPISYTFSSSVRNQLVLNLYNKIRNIVTNIYILYYLCISVLCEEGVNNRLFNSSQCRNTSEEFRPYSCIDLY